MSSPIATSNQAIANSHFDAAVQYFRANPDKELSTHLLQRMYFIGHTVAGILFNMVKLELLKRQHPIEL